MSFIQEGKKKSRNELDLPKMKFVVVDDWADKLGEKSFVIWMKLHTYVDRRDKHREYDCVPRSLESLMEKLKVSKATFYRLIKPLWEYGLIDIVEYEESKRNSQKPKNIIVYEYPFNEFPRSIAPLEKLRDWDKDYKSASKEYGKTGGKPRKVEQPEEPEEPEEPAENDGFKNETVDGFKNETVDGFKNETVTVSKMKPNNYTNISINSSNSSINSTNGYSNCNYKEQAPDEIPTENTPNEFEIKLLQSTDNFYTKFAIGRYSKKQWNTLINKFVSDTLTRYDNEKIPDDKIDDFVYVCLSKIADNTDYKYSEEYAEYLAVISESCANPDAIKGTWLDMQERGEI